MPPDFRFPAFTEVATEDVDGRAEVVSFPLRWSTVHSVKNPDHHPEEEDGFQIYQYSHNGFFRQRMVV